MSSVQKHTKKKVKGSVNITVNVPIESHHIPYILVHLHPSSNWNRGVTSYVVETTKDVVETHPSFCMFPNVDMYKLDRENATPLEIFMHAFIPQDHYKRDGYPIEEAEVRREGRDWYTDEVGEVIINKGGKLVKGDLSLNEGLGPRVPPVDVVPHVISGVVHIGFDL